MNIEATPKEIAEIVSLLQNQQNQRNKLGKISFTIDGEEIGSYCPKETDCIEVKAVITNLDELVDEVDKISSSIEKIKNLNLMVDAI